MDTSREMVHKIVLNIRSLGLVVVLSSRRESGNVPFFITAVNKRCSWTYFLSKKKLVKFFSHSSATTAYPLEQRFSNFFHIKDPLYSYIS